MNISYSGVICEGAPRVGRGAPAPPHHRPSLPTSSPTALPAHPPRLPPRAPAAPPPQPAAARRQSRRPQGRGARGAAPPAEQARRMGPTLRAGALALAALAVAGPPPAAAYRPQGLLRLPGDDAKEFTGGFPGARRPLEVDRTSTLWCLRRKKVACGDEYANRVPARVQLEGLKDQGRGWRLARLVFPPPRPNCWARCGAELPRVDELRCVAGETWALLIAGSAGWGNYRHQADVCHVWRSLAFPAYCWLPFQAAVFMASGQAMARATHGLSKAFGLCGAGIPDSEEWRP